MRYLGQFPSESDLKETIIPELLEEDPSRDGLVSFEAFERLMLRYLSDHTYDPDDSETLLAAFRVLDPQGHGYIDSNLMHEWLSTKGGKAADFFKERETSDFLEYAKDKESSDSSRIYYEDYVAKLNADIEKHLENLYQVARGSGRQ
ncbi:Efcab2 [Symbiodinium natans]|nr:Efcab2 [Symbiodinium necroappetens]CAE7620410.1 Efcab2 [Symbiodinium natans]